MMFNHREIEKKSIVILQTLNQAQKPVGARLIARHMEDCGVTLSERAVRYHLQFMDERGLTRLVGRRDGRVITKLGVEELRNARVHDKVGFAISRIETLAYRTTFDPKQGQGLIPVNVSFFPKKRFRDALTAMKPVFKAGIAVSELVAIAEEGKRLGEIIVPKGHLGIATVCSIVANGVFLKSGIPVDSRFGGILQIKGDKPLRFVELIHYSGSSLDPSEAFIRAKMTTVRKVARKGEGKILANFRELPGICRRLAEEMIANLDKVGIRGVLSIGEMSESICGVPVDVNKIGAILIGGLNPVACAQEAGIEADNLAMATVMEYQDLKRFSHVCRGFEV
ncbi:MAG: NrpR regulatory domain-containing protein [Thermodesulfobacteriota bacterium]|nr:NrpR regulatory domain-containing protein [Thermodesulfobacteriota bacterium]